MGISNFELRSERSPSTSGISEKSATDENTNKVLRSVKETLKGHLTSTSKLLQNTKATSQLAIGFGKNFYWAVAPLGYRAKTMDDISSCVRLTDIESRNTVKYEWPKVNTPPWRNEDLDTRNLSDITETYDHLIEQIVCSSQASIFLTKSGKIYQQGTLNGVVSPNPMLIRPPSTLKVIQVAAGRHFAMALLEKGGGVVCWGAGHFGQLGPRAGYSTASNDPVLIERLLPQNNLFNSPVITIAAGDWHALALTASGKVWAWGCNRHLQCGQDLKSTETHRVGEDDYPDFTQFSVERPELVTLPVPMSKIAAGKSHSVAVSANADQVFCWGNNRQGQCGSRNVNRISGNKPEAVKDLDGRVKVNQIAAAGNHTIVLTNCGKVMTWGDHTEGQLGVVNGSTLGCLAHFKPRVVTDFGASLNDVKVNIDPGSPQSCVLSLSSDAHATSTPKTQSNQDSLTPKIVTIAAGDTFSACATSSGELYVWGSNDCGQLGLPIAKNSQDCPYLRDGGKIPLRKQTNGNSTSSLLNSSSSRSSQKGRKCSLKRPVRNVCTFDSEHNVLLPLLVGNVSHIHVRQIACGSNHMWVIGDAKDSPSNSQFSPYRSTNDASQSLVDVQTEQRSMKNKNIISIDKSNCGFGGKNSSSLSQACFPHSLHLSEFMSIEDDGLNKDHQPGSRFALSKQTLQRRQTPLSSMQSGNSGSENFPWN